MELYIGGYAQGKLDYVKSLYGDSREIWNDFHLWVKEAVEEEKMPEIIEEEIFLKIEKNPDIIIISDEIGNGIVPMEEKERFYREYTGRVLIKIAEKADKVTRIICGVPQRIK